MGVWKLYRYEDQVLAPTMVVTNEGVFVETQPVMSVSIDAPDEVISLVKDTLETEAQAATEEDLNNPDTPLRDLHSQPVLLEILQIKKWQDFEKRALMYTLHRLGSEITLHITGRGADGMWSIADSSSRSFSGVPIEEACNQIAAELISRRPVASPRALGLAMLPSPPPESGS